MEFENQWYSCYAYPEEVNRLVPLKDGLDDYIFEFGEGAKPDEAREALASVRFRGSADMDDFHDDGGYAICFTFASSPDPDVLNVVWYLDSDGYWKFGGIQYWVLDELVMDAGEENEDFYIEQTPDTDETMFGRYVYCAEDIRFTLDLDEAPF